MSSCLQNILPLPAYFLLPSLRERQGPGREAWGRKRSVLEVKIQPQILLSNASALLLRLSLLTPTGRASVLLTHVSPSLASQGCLPCSLISLGNNAGHHVGVISLKVHLSSCCNILAHDRQQLSKGLCQKHFH